MNQETDSNGDQPKQEPEQSAQSGSGNSDSGKPDSSKAESSKADKHQSGSDSNQRAGKILDDLSRRSAAGKPRKRAGSRRMNPLLVLLMTLPFLAAAFFVTNQQYRLQSIVSELRQDNAQLRGQVAAQSNSLSEQSSRLARMQDELDTPDPVDLTVLRQTEAELNRQIDFLRQQLGQLESRQREVNEQPDFDWKLQEADFLLRQASAQIELDNDLDSALNLMQMADEALVASGLTGIVAVREALADDMTALRNTERLDRETLYLRLSQLGDALTEVDLLESMREQFLRQRQQSSEPVDMGAGEEGWLGSGLNFLSEVFVWREWDEQPQAMLASGQQSVVKQNLRLMVKQAQIAVLDRDEQLYRQSLEEIEALLHRYAVPDSTQGQDLMSELESLRGIEVDQPQPELRATLNAMQQLLASSR